MKKIVSLAVLSALSLTSIANAANAEQLAPNAIRSTVVASESIDEFAPYGLGMEFQTVTGAYEYVIVILNTSDNSIVTVETSGNGMTCGDAKLGTVYKLWVRAYDKNGRLLRQTDPNGNYVKYTTPGQKVNLTWK
ncbi:RHS repeat domain-containing protein [Paenibacillus elgii]|uniref:RHS repeat domain-containing protein n=1 Tax=Paenibacillus elgii TaxID=189691 RepID=UPI0013D02C66|nr:RHS repeat domain-containing protein [Paenibacillus elgii]